MAKLVLNDVASLQFETSALATLADNNDRIEAVLENTLSRDGTGPNQMEASLDMNSQRLINLAPPQASTDAARLVDIAEALSVDQALVPALVTGRILSNDGTVMTWVLPSSLPGIGDMLASNNLSELIDDVVARTNLGLGSAAVAAVGTSGDALGKLNTNLTWSGTQAYTALGTFSGGFVLSGAVNYRMTYTGALTTDSVGYRGAPINIQNTNYTLLMTDSGCTIRHTDATAYAWTIPSNASVALPVGTVIAFVNDGSGIITITRGAGVELRRAGSSTDQNVALAADGMASAIKTATNTWRISGVGLS